MTDNIPVIYSASDVPVTGPFGRGYEKRDRTVDPTAGFAKPCLIKAFDRKEIIERANERKAKGWRIYDEMQRKGVKPLNQGQTPLCWCNGATDAVQVSRVLSGSEHVPLSPASVAGPVKNYKYVGGWGIQAVKYGSEHGWVPQSMWPANELNKKYDTDETRAVRAKYQVASDGWTDLPEEDWLILWTHLVLGFPCTMAHMEYQHLVLAIDVDPRADGSIDTICRNSGFGRDSTGHSKVNERFGLPDEALAIQVVTAA